MISDFIYCRNNWKDFIIPTLAICLPVLLTLYITRRDRKDNVNHRKEDLLRYENDKLQSLKSDNEKRKQQQDKVWKHFETYLNMTIITGQSHLSSIDNLIIKSSFSAPGTLAVVILVNEHLQALLNIDYREIGSRFKDSKYLQFLNSIKILDRLYIELMDWSKRYRTEHAWKSSAFDTALQQVFYEIERLRFDEEFDKEVLINLNTFKKKYDDYEQKFNKEISQSTVKEVFILKEIFIDENFMKLKDKYNYMHDILLNLEKSIIGLDRLSEYSESTLTAIKNGMMTHFAILQTIGGSLFSDVEN